jgi:Galactose oxidase, central domain/Kelch motif
MSETTVTRRTFALGSALALSSALLPGTRRSPAALAADPAWEQLTSDGAPPPARWDHTLAADDAGQQLLLFGGRDAGGAPFGDAWLYDVAGATWTPIDGDGPSPRFGQAVAVDQKTHRLYLFGGQSADAFFNDTWQFEFETRRWKQLDGGAGPAPSPRYGLTGIVDGRGHFLVSHGFTDDGRFDDTWSFDLKHKTWTDVSPAEGGVRPLRRCLHELVWNPMAKRMLLYGGCSSGYGPCPQGDLWSYDPADRAWTELTPPSGPSPRSNPALVWDKTGNRAWLFGGLTDAGYAADLWTASPAADTFAWSDTGGDPGPSPRASHDAVLTGGRLYLFGGTGEAGPLNDLWRLKLPQ